MNRPQQQALVPSLFLLPGEDLAFGFCYMMTITYQTIGDFQYGLFLSLILQGLFYIPFIPILPKFFNVSEIYFSQPAADYG